MARFLPDTSCMVAALCSWHEGHEVATQEVERRLESGQCLVAAAPALIETYAVLTRLPAPHRLSPADTRTLLEGSFMASAVEVIALQAEGYRDLLVTAPERGIAGGRTYDAVIAACARRGGVDTILTFNERQFLQLARDGIEVVVPS